MQRTAQETRAALRAAAKERILVLDGAMGTMIQDLKLSEADFRGEIFKDHGHDQKGNNDILILSQPDAIRDIHLAYFLAGADICETNTFSSTSIAQADYGCEAYVHALNRDGARLARRAVQQLAAQRQGPRHPAAPERRVDLLALLAGQERGHRGRQNQFSNANNALDHHFTPATGIALE